MPHPKIIFLNDHETYTDSDDTVVVDNNGNVYDLQILLSNLPIRMWEKSRLSRQNNPLLFKKLESTLEVSDDSFTKLQ